ncbi:MAG: MFS transporter [Ignavibacteria bacterium]|nr:MFS transporter [Ignavibacteria bacterium]
MKTPKKTLFAWYLYDWANSGFVTTVVTVFLGPFLTSLAAQSASSDGNINIFGLQIYSESLFVYLVSFSVVLQLIFLPIIGAYADFYQIKRQLLFAFAYLGSFATILLFFLNENTLHFGSVSFIIANLSFGISVVMYNSLLNEIATESERDRVSSIGWAFGYLGGGTLLALNLLLFFFRNNFGINEQTATRISLASAGIWWAVFAFISHINLNIPKSTILATETFQIKPFRKLYETFKELFKNKNTVIFLLAYLFFNDGVQTVIVVSAQFARRELAIAMETIVLTILAVQFLSFFGALLMGKISEKLNAKRTLILCISLWSFIVFYAFLFLKDIYGFIFLSFLITLVLGGTQALSRSLFSLLIPKSSEAEYYSIYEISEKGTSWIGPLAFGFALQISKSYRIAIFSLILFFLFGLFFLKMVKMPKTETLEQK